MAKKAGTSTQAAAVNKGKGKEKASASRSANTPVTPSRKLRTLNLNTYKVHALGGYAKAIRKYGTTDNYNSQMVRSCTS
jgi:hypothetical protein